MPLVLSLLLAAYISSLVIHFLPQQPPNPPHNCKLLKSTVCISPLFLILAQRCVLKIGLSFATTFFPPNIEQPVVVVIYNQMQTPHCCGFLELFTAAKNCQELPRRATGQKETVEMRGHEFCYSKCRSLSQMNAGNERTPPP